MKKFVGIGIGLMAIGAGAAIAWKYIFGKKNTVQEEQGDATKARYWFFKKEKDRKEDETVDIVVKGFTA